MRTTSAFLGLGVAAAAAAALAVAPDGRCPGRDACSSPVACTLFAPGTPQDYVDQVTASLWPALPRFDLHGNAWFGGGTGTGGTLRYSFPPDGINIPSGFTGDPSGPNEIHARLNSLFAAQGGAPFWKGLFRQVFDRFEDLTGVRYIEVADDGASWGADGSATRGDLRIAMRPIDGGLGVLAWNHFPPEGDMVLDRAENWSSSVNNFRYLRNTIAHEHGHGLGLMHICPTNASKLMEPFLVTVFDGPQHDDIRGAQRMYGDTLEPNNGGAGFTNLGVLGFPTVIDVNDLSLRDSADVDVFRLQFPANTRLTVRAVPVGMEYDQAPQPGGGPCSSGDPFDSLSLANLRFAVQNGAQSTILLVDDAGIGQAEELVNMLFASGGIHHIRISTTTTGFSSQSYRLEIRIRDALAPACAADISDDGQVNSSDLGTLLAEWGNSASEADLNDDGIVNSSDLGVLLASWGLCP